MTRGLRGLNRVVAFVVGLALLVVGVAAVLWWTGTLGDLWDATPETLDPSRAEEVTSTGWFGAVATACGAVLALLALWWLAAHLASPRAGTVTLRGSDPAGRLTLDPGALAGHVAEQARRLPGVVGARTVVDRERGRHVLVSTLQVDPETDLPTLADQVADLVADARDVAGIQGLAARTRLAVRRRARGGPRVR
ncbi:alkaline shock response membrane anchor protein AmaP [Cellulomonas dongxiuzhuiae]|uniref:alkaline shock response membrane anchor protein AmaP n=1 Tax=Cellulomonas dongxiuzhuiae TaxID=2819979 RepID=UPI001AAE78F2|nr:alkaline shock response membrane anchor protein AmaP [Cellulomonas dongxiuzhuiae]MBO3089700.1 alkaline shock response membrane anchor protein AmaP [Cellulomonas dongxiuzhuiae]